MPKTKKTTSVNKKTAAKTKTTAQKAEKEKRPPSTKSEINKSVKSKDKYFEGIGRRKTATVRVRLFSQKKGGFLINNKPLEEYFQRDDLREIVFAPLKLMNSMDRFEVSARIKGGGLVSQAEAIRHGIARALVLFNPEFRKKLKKAGFLKRDPRMRERKKFGLKRARRAPQWRKR